MNSCLEAFVLLVLTCRCEEKPEWFGTVLSRISTARACQLLSGWSFDLPELEPWAHLAQRVSAAPSPAFPLPLSAALRPEQHLRGDLSTAYLLGCLIDGAPVPRDSSRVLAFTDWFDSVRLWLVGQALIRALRSNYLDGNIRVVASAIRHAAARNPDWLRLVSELYEPLPRDFEGLSNVLRRRAQAMLVDPERSLSSAQQKMLQALIRVARNEDSFFAAPQQSENDFLARFALQPRKRGDEQPLHVLVGEEDCECELVVESSEGIDGDVARIAHFDGEPASTPSQRRITGKSILLQSNEIVQYLPWSWHQLTDHERSAIKAWLEHDQTGLGKDALLASFVWMALVTGYTLVQVCNFEVGNEVARDWRINVSLDAISRKAPRPSYRRALPSDLVDVLIEPASTHTIGLPAWVRNILVESGTSSSLTRLADLWTSSGETPTQAFFRIRNAHGFPRVTPGMLGHVLGYSLYHSTADCLFAFTAAAHARSALPGACAYPSWSEAELHDTYQALQISADLEVMPVSGVENAIGSRLRMAEMSLVSILAKTFQGLKAKISQGSLIEQHNAYTTALVVKLLAATGSRPVSDPFESPLHFDLTLNRIFIADKLVSGTESGRLVPIPRSLSVEVECYLEYLKKLAVLLNPVQPGLASALFGLRDMRSPFQIPLLFYMAVDGWVSVSGDTLVPHLASDFTAPLNIFRHRLAVVLRSKGVEAEVIDGLLGHGYGGCCTYGDWSVRQWCADMEKATPALESAFDDLGLPMLKTPVLQAAPELAALPELQSAVFGIARRRIEQRRRRETARRQARALIEDWLMERKIEEITSEDLIKIERALISTPSGMPHVMAQVRYSVLQRYFYASLRRGATKLRLRRTYIELNEDLPFTTELAVQAPEVVKKLVDDLPALRKEFPPSRATVNDAKLMACLHLMIESRVSNSSLLEKITDPQVIKVVHFRRRYWIEFRANPDQADSHDDEPSACLRIPISRDCAAFLFVSRVVGRNKRNAHVRLASILKDVNVDVTAMSYSLTVQTIARYVDQNNRLHLPGVLAGVLSGRVSTHSLDRYDWVRLETGERLSITVLESDEARRESLSLSPTGIDQVKVDDLLRANQQAEARLYFNALRRAIYGKSTDRDTLTRRKMVSAVGDVLKEYKPRVSSALYLVGEWLFDLVRSVRSLNSVRRYLSGISPAAEAVWYEADLMGADEEGVGELYEALLCARPEIELRTVGLYLRRFHAFAKKFGCIPDPDWGELPVGEVSVSVCPAYIRESDYLDALNLLKVSEPQYGKELVSLASMTLLLAYRYGLRASEALGLTRADWVGETYPLLLVRNNVLRKLKTKAGRRLVPTLFEMTSIELKLISETIVKSEANHGDCRNVPVLGTKVSSATTIGRIRKLVITALRLVTGNPTTVIHSARHSFAMRVLDSMLDASSGDKRSRLDVPVNGEMRDRVLGDARQSRRTLWGVARLLGHASPSTSVGTYAHILDRWLSEYISTDVTRRTRGTLLDGAYDLDAVSRLEKHECHIEGEHPIAVTVGGLVRLARLISRGVSESRAALGLDIPEVISKEIVIGLERVFRVSAKRQERERPLPELMRSITDEQWESLIAFADSLELSNDINWIKVPTALELANLLGPQRHLVMWREEHFQWAGQIAKSLCLHKTDASLLSTPALSAKQRTWIDKYDLSRLVAEGSSGTQLDTVRAEGQSTVVVERAVLALSQNKARAVSNRMLMSAMVIAWSGAVSQGRVKEDSICLADVV